MNENDLYTILQGDYNLREAIRRREQKQSTMPADLNDRLMKRLGPTPNPIPGLCPPTRSLFLGERRTRFFRWISAAACLLIIVGIGVTLMPREESHDVVVPSSGEFAIKIAASEEKLLTPPLIPPLQGRGAAAHNKGKAVRQRVEMKKGVAVSQRMETSKELADTQKMETPESLIRNEAKAVLASSVKEEEKLMPAVLTERDIPITRPENYRYTPEEIALLKKQADDAYVKWVQLELEIAKYNLEQMAQQ